MASKKTSQEISGYPITGPDEFRIARSGNNFKLTSYDIISETITRTQLLSKISASSLIPGRHYKVTGMGTGHGTPPAATITVLATKPAEIANIGIVDLGSNKNFTCGLDFSADLITYIIDNNANIIYGYFDASPTYRFPTSGNIGFNNTIYNYGMGSLITNTTNTTINNSTVHGILGISGMNIESCEFTGPGAGVLGSANAGSSMSNCKLTNSIVRVSSGTANLYNCNFINCYVNISGTTSLSNITIIGGTDGGGNPATYSFDNETINNGTVVYKQYSTINKYLDLNNLSIYNPVNETLYLPLTSNWVGTYYLQNSTNPTIYVIQPNNDTQIHTPISFKLDMNNSPGTASFTMTDRTSLTIDNTLAWNEICHFLVGSPFNMSFEEDVLTYKYSLNTGFGNEGWVLVDFNKID